ncbi:BTAD domain-containing putative transcriptional regulator [Streptomyces sp. NPDC050560]|uniref:AfsR/SARP family transcriptional regulator n=1 Tax=Streptomyces sp. NPDC050560 TaxID=3365630 RepID=UPI0037A21755
MQGGPGHPEQRPPAAESGLGGAALRFTVLGPVRAWRGAESLAAGSPQQRALLAALLLREGRTATAAELIDALWASDPPSHALSAVRTYASRLRKTLGPDALVSVAGGYAVEAAPGALDLAVARELESDAVKARENGDLARATELLGRALGMWNGEALAGLPGPFAEGQRVRLEEWRLQLLESRLDMDLEQGRHAEAVSELTALTAAHPLRERLRELLMLALYRSGRQAEALAVYADTHKLLTDELGVDPRPGLRELQRRILQADAALAQPAVNAQQTTGAVRPAQLPAQVPDFTGRSDFVSELTGRLTSDGGRVMAVSAVAGIGGVGKTTLAVHVAHEARAAFPDGQLYVDLQGTSALPAAPETVLGAFLRALGTPESAIPDSAAERAALYRSMLDDRRVLVLLDNAHDAAQVRPLLPGAEGCAALVTSRSRMVDLAGAHLVDLDVMAPEEALRMFLTIVGEDRVAAERDCALDVVAACGFLPLAIRIAASRLAARRTWTVRFLADRLADERRRLDELQAGDLAVAASFELGYGQLEPAQARAFRLLGLAEGPDISLAAAAAVLDLPLTEAEDVLESLVDTSLLETTAPGRYRYHDLVRLYARSCAARDEDAASVERAVSRLVDFYLATASRAYGIERPGDRLVDHLAATRYPGLALEDRHAARDWLFTEAAPLLACVRLAVGTAERAGAIDLLWVAHDLGESGANAPEFEAVCRAAVAASQEAGDARAEARALTMLAYAHLFAGQFGPAEEMLTRAAEVSDPADDPFAACWQTNIRGVAGIYQNRYEDAECHLVSAVASFRSFDDRPGEASALCNLSRVHLVTGRTATAVSLAERGTAMYEEMGGHTLRGANGRYALALALTRDGRYTQAVGELRQALAVFRDSRQRLWEGMTLFRIAEIDLAEERPAPAAEHAESALTVLRGIGGDWRRANVLTVLGQGLYGIGQSGRAEVCWREALGVFRRLKAPEEESVRKLLAPLAVA